jgi:glucose/arabinose dehydrogenase
MLLELLSIILSMLLARLSRHRVGRTCSLPLEIVIACLCGWWSTTPLYAHDIAEHGIAQEVSIADDGVADVALPPRFVVRTVVSGLTLPTDMVILPSGDFLVTEKGVGSDEFSTAHVRLVRQGVLQPDPVLTLRVNERWDSGLYSIVLDPQFAANHYFYLWYSTGESSLGWQGKTVNRLSRFTYDPTSGKASPASETIILDDVPWSPLHNGGGLAFDPEGNLWVTTGDATLSLTFTDGHLSQDFASLNGKVLRIRPKLTGGYDLPSNNPFANRGGVRPEIYASGLRNPFRMTQRGADQKFYFIDVGQESWEEVNELVAGANYGWPYREGMCPIYVTDEDCTPAPEQYTDPILSYAHPPEGGAGITAMTFYEGTAWPAQYRGRLFFADFNSNWVGMVDLDDPDKTVTQFATGLASLADMEATPEGIYAVSIYDQKIVYIYYAEDGNLPPSAQFQATPTTGAAPLSVEFTAIGSEDADGDTLSYRWDFGDASEIVMTNTPTATHLYAQDGDYLATLQVVDGRGGESEILTQLIQLYSGAKAQIFQENLADPIRTLYQGGDQIRFRAMREGDTLGLDPDRPFVWTILLHHNEHIHTVKSEAVGSEVVLDLPTETHALGAPVWYEIQLAMQTASGQVLRTMHELHPQTIHIQSQSWPGKTAITLNQQVQNPDKPTLVIVGQQYVLEAGEIVVHDQKVGRFTHWLVTDAWPVVSTAGETEFVTERRYEFVAPTASKSYIAFYEYLRPARRTYLPAMPNQLAQDSTLGEVAGEVTGEESE